MANLLYIHGYGSTGNAVKAQKLQAMFPQHQVLAPTFDYDRLAPQEVFRQLQETILSHRPALVLGSSMGGYYALCCTQFYPGTVWCVNPVHDIVGTIRRHLAASAENNISAVVSLYEDFDQSVFRQLHPIDGQLHFALSTDDELLGDHLPLLSLFPNHGSVVWKDHCGHLFLRFDELKEALAQSLSDCDRQ